MAQSKEKQLLYLHKWRNDPAHPERKKQAITRARKWKMENIFGITIKEYNQLLTKQGRKCALCGQRSKNKRLAVDHDHATGKVRGLLCGSCNTALGKFGDDIAGVTRVLEYLRRSK